MRDLQITLLFRKEPKKFNDLLIIEIISLLLKRAFAMMQEFNKFQLSDLLSPVSIFSVTRIGV